MINKIVNEMNETKKEKLEKAINAWKKLSNEQRAELLYLGCKWYGKSAKNKG